MLASLATTLLFFGGIPGVGSMVVKLGWRKVWIIMALVVLVIGLLVVLLISDPQTQVSSEEDAWSITGMSLLEVLRSSDLSLDFTTEIRDWVLAIMMMFGLIGNLFCRWFMLSLSVLRVFEGSMMIFAGCLIGFPMVSGSLALICVVAVALGVGRGAATVIFFTGFAEVFGKRDLGKIQGVAQAITVAASGTGPLFFAWSFESSASYSTAFFAVVPLALIVGLWAFCQQGSEGES